MFHIVYKLWVITTDRRADAHEIPRFIKTTHIRVGLCQSGQHLNLAPTALRLRPEGSAASRHRRVARKAKASLSSR